MLPVVDWRRENSHVQVQIVCMVSGQAAGHCCAPPSARWTGSMPSALIKAPFRLRGRATSNKLASLKANKRLS